MTPEQVQQFAAMQGKQISREEAVMLAAMMGGNSQPTPPQAPQRMPTWPSYSDSNGFPGQNRVMPQAVARSGPRRHPRRGQGLPIQVTRTGYRTFWQNASAVAILLFFIWLLVTT